MGLLYIQGSALPTWEKSLFDVLTSPERKPAGEWSFSLTIGYFFYKNGLDIIMGLEYSKKMTDNTPVTNLLIGRAANLARTPPSLMLQSFKYVKLWYRWIDW